MTLKLKNYEMSISRNVNGVVKLFHCIEKSNWVSQIDICHFAYLNIAISID